MILELLKQVKPTKEYEKQAIEYIKEFHQYNSEINGVGGLDRYLEDYDGWLEKLEEDRNRIPNKEKVPAETYFLVKTKDNTIVGMVNIRLVLNEKLKKFGGNIGYSIRPTERRKGYNKVNLYLALLVCQKYGIKEVFMDCDKNNIASRRTIESLGGLLLQEYFDDENNKCVIQYFKINVEKSINDNKNKYKKWLGEIDNEIF